MKIQILNEFIVLADKKNYSAAADFLYISQSSLSKHILNLEDELGFTIFDRNTRNIELTPYGHKLLEYSKAICDLYNGSILKIKDTIDNQNEIIRLSSIPVMPHYAITNEITNFKLNHPFAKFVITEHDSAELLNLLLTNQVDLAFMRIEDVKSAHIEYVPFVQDEMVVVLPDEHRYAKNTTIHISLLKDEEFLFLHENTSLYTICVNVCKAAGFAPNIVYTGHRIENILDLIEKGMGISLLMSKHVEYYHDTNVTIVNLHPKTTSVIGLCKVKNHELSINSQKFWNIVKAKHIK
ncbi:LysR family transcriptional regulator [Mariniplasma anaerobium]|uniref:LysR family transcriptional regulator n=1 Tax=Mariniplasma anaerobium TaxID=2735436 RepID=A0A7U9TJU8_9MOLU|nr:LysR family transcriptional regulator [Mariniplasma anaerobium]BCR36722.1 LysR family transcriptional regulator [Mariniplasma anaerobium]